ncbi:hypothetical protein CAEBREN_25830 [Caenorhabditis brenneri]|uniref:F-box domain-containing protein n=1 Tax=Caenorhabditis brenneri TaxID=135651 RepID=G0NCR4_CAEBE|nr:hypothetical protein CAEBREN_25830 [Caenorhabditis brenneri]
MFENKDDEELQQRPFALLRNPLNKTMNIGLLRFPFLVQKEIFEEIDLLSALSIAMLSKKSHATVRTCLRHHKYHLRYLEDYFIQLERKFGKDDGHALVLVLTDQTPPLLPYQVWRIGEQEALIKSTSSESNETTSTFTHVYSGNLLDFAAATLQFLSRLLRKLYLTLNLKTRNVDNFRKTMKSVENAGEIKEINVVEHVWNRDPVSQHELVKVVLDECQQAKKLCVTIRTPDSFEYATSVPFKFDFVSIVSTGWICRNHFIKLFLSCKKVLLQSKNFDEEDLNAILKAWTEGSPLEQFHFIGTQDFYLGKTLNNILEELPEAAPVRNAIISPEMFAKPRIAKFGEGECFLIQQNDEQTTALVCIVNQSVMLSTNFLIGKEVDEMLARIEEELILPDENVEVEED